MALIAILLFKFFAVSLESFVSLYLNEYFIIFVFAIGVPEMILDIICINLFKILSSLFLHLNIKMHCYLGAAPAGDYSVMLLIA